MLRIGIWLAVVLFAAAAVSMGYALYRKAGGGDAVPAVASAPSAPPGAPPPATRPPADAKTVIDRNLFKAVQRKEAKAAAAESQPKPPEPTKLNLKLWGTMIQTGGEPVAVIEDGKERRQYLFRVGDVVQDAEIREIQREKVLLGVQGRSEFLTIEQGRGGGSGAAPAGAAASGRTAETAPTGPAAPAGSGYDAPPGTGFTGKVPTLVPRIRGSSPGQKSNSPFPGSAPRTRATQPRSTGERSGETPPNSALPQGD
jgi:hypothetical protein